MPTELRQERAPTSKPLPPFLLRTFEVYLPHVLGVTDPKYADLVDDAVARFDAYVQAIPAHEPGRTDLRDLLFWMYVYGTFLGFPKQAPMPPWQQSAKRREEFVERMFSNDGSLMERGLDRLSKANLGLDLLPKRMSARDLAKSVREMMGLAFYSNPRADFITGYERVWDRSYPDRLDVDLGRLQATRQPARFDPKVVASVHVEGHPYRNRNLFANDGRPKIAVIGSGAGGAVVAARLAAQKCYDVAVFEAGPRLPPRRYPMDTLVGMSQLFESGLLTLSKDLDIHLLRGRLVGGGTVLTSGLSVRLRSETQRAWCSTSGELSIGVPYDELDAGLDAVLARQTLEGIDERLYTDPSDLLGRGAAALKPGEDRWVFDRDAQQLNNVVMRAGREARPDQNGDSCFGCGLCNYGCHFGHKMSMDLTYILDAERDGARIHPNLPVERLEGDFDHGKVRVTHLVLGRGVDEERVEVDQVILAAGAVGSSALLLRSAEHDPAWKNLPAFRGHVGEGLGFNYGSGVVARWKEPWKRPGHLGFQIKFVATKHGDPDFAIPVPGRPVHQARFVLENAFVPPGLMSNVVPGVGEEHRRWMESYRSLAMCATTIGSPQTGSISAERQVTYRVTKKEMDLNRNALAGIARLYFAAGAEEVGLAGVRQGPDGDGVGLKLTRERYGDKTEAEIAEALEEVLIDPEHIMLSSAHPQGGLRMSKAPGQGAVDSEFRLRDAYNLQVVDGSLFPSTIVVNPQWTIAALAEVAAKRLHRRWS